MYYAVFEGSVIAQVFHEYFGAVPIQGLALVIYGVSLEFAHRSWFMLDRPYGPGPAAPHRAAPHGDRLRDGPRSQLGAQAHLCLVRVS